MTLEAQSEAAAEAARRKAWIETVRAKLGTVEEENPGGILDIDLPMPLPGPFVRAIGPGANLKVRGSERITFGGQSSSPRHKGSG